MKTRAVLCLLGVLALGAPALAQAVKAEVMITSIKRYNLAGGVPGATQILHAKGKIKVPALEGNGSFAPVIVLYRWHDEMADGTADYANEENSMHANGSGPPIFGTFPVEFEWTAADVGVWKDFDILGDPIAAGGPHAGRSLWALLPWVVSVTCEPYNGHTGAKSLGVPYTGEDFPVEE